MAYRLFISNNLSLLKKHVNMSYALFVMDGY